jgi:hypothetical protein
MVTMMKLRHLALPALLLCASSMACSAASDAGSDDDTTEDALTSLTARARTLKFDAYVYVSANAQDYEILSAIKHQNQSAFGALRTADIGVNSRELKDVDPATFVKSQVKVIDTSKPGDVGKTMMRVKYRYTDNALVPKSMATRSGLTLAVLAGSYQNQSERILKECTENGEHDREFQSSIWYVFNPSLSQCQSAITAEQKTIDADRKIIGTDTTKVALSEVNRLYVPVTLSLTRARNNGSASYPEYDRLYAGGVKPGRLVISMVNGKMADWAAGEEKESIDDDGYQMYWEGLQEIFAARPGFKFIKTDPVEDLTSFTTASGKTYKVPGGIMDIMKWELDGSGWPAGVDYPKQRELRVAAGKKLAKHWITFEAPTTVKIGSADAKPVTIELNTYLEAVSDSTPHKRAIKNSDIFVYNGHSYIGYGPLDPSRFTAADFPSSYQIMFVNGCVSYNYYEKDYIPLKQGGTQNLDLVSNGLESWVNGSGPAMGRFVGSIINGKQSSYTDILKAAQFTGYGYAWGQDALRVVDGELDNKYFPSKVKITVQ